MDDSDRDQSKSSLPQLIIVPGSPGHEISEAKVQQALDAAGLDCIVTALSGASAEAIEVGSSTRGASGSASEDAVCLSIVIPVYNEADGLPELFRRLTATMQGLAEPYEIIFVDDGSTDGSLDILESIFAMDRIHVRIISLSRNFGHQQAISAGLDRARGRATIVMDADLQDPPEVIPAFVDKWHAGYQVVYAVREKRKEPIIKRASYRFFYLVLRSISRVDMPLDAGDFGLMDRCVVDVIRSLPERNRFVRGLRSWVGFRRIGVPYDRDARFAGKTKYTFRRLVGLALDGMISFSYFPLRLGTLLGFIVSALSIVIGAYYLIRALTTGIGLPGFATIVILVSFLGGVQLLTLGIIGEYLGHTLEEVKHRPAHIVRRTFGCDDDRVAPLEGPQ